MFSTILVAPRSLSRKPNTMRGLFGIVIAAAVIQIATAAVKCPPRNEADVTLIGNPEKCSTYYLCNEGYPFLMDCPPGLYFNPELRVCDWTIREEKNGCRLPEVPQTTPTRPTTPSSSTTTATPETSTTTTTVSPDAPTNVRGP